MLERLDAIDALEQIHSTIMINAAGRRIAFRPAYPFATFDYRRLCAIPLANWLDGVEMAVAPVLGRDPDGTLLLGDRGVRAPVVVDATGWRAVVAHQSGGAALNRDQHSIGLEARHDHGGCTLEFWVRPAERPDGLLWAFPAGDHVWEGVASYAGRGTGLKATLARVPHERDLPAKAVHGGLLPAKLGNPVAGDVFVVGDAAGQCLPLTGEGIRPALVWGQEAGRWARRAVDGTVSLDDAPRLPVRRSSPPRREGHPPTPPGWVAAPSRAADPACGPAVRHRPPSPGGAPRLLARGRSRPAERDLAIRFADHPNEYCYLMSRLP